MNYKKKKTKPKTKENVPLNFPQRKAEIMDSKALGVDSGKWGLPWALSASSLQSVHPSVSFFTMLQATPSLLKRKFDKRTHAKMSQVEAI